MSSPAATGPMPAGSAATAARPQIIARLPVSDWQIRWRLQPDGRTVLEVTGQAGNLTGLAASTRLPIVSRLWIAAVTGHYTAARCRTPAAAAARQLMPVTTPPPPR
jgi:hypothetical protein